VKKKLLSGKHTNSNMIMEVTVLMAIRERNGRKKCI